MSLGKVDIVDDFRTLAMWTLAGRKINDRKFNDVSHFSLFLRTGHIKNVFNVHGLNVAYIFSCDNG